MPPPAAPKTAAAAVHPGAGNPESTDSLPAPATIAGALRDRPELLQSLVGRFLATLPESSGNLRAALERGDAPEAERLSHWLVGSLLVFGAQRAAEEARRLEARAREGRLDEAGEALDRLEGDLTELKDFLQKKRNA